MADFQHRHYAKVAALLCEAEPPASEPQARAKHNVLITKFAEMFARDNPRFDLRRFMDAVRGSPLGKDADSAGVARVAGRRYL